MCGSIGGRWIGIWPEWVEAYHSNRVKIFVRMERRVESSSFTIDNGHHSGEELPRSVIFRWLMMMATTTTDAQKRVIWSRWKYFELNVETDSIRRWATILETIQMRLGLQKANYWWELNVSRLFLRGVALPRRDVKVRCIGEKNTGARATTKESCVTISHRKSGCNVHRSLYRSVNRREFHGVS